MLVVSVCVQGTDDGSEESSSEDKELEEGAGPSSLSGQSVDSSQTSAQATPTDSDAFPEFVPKTTSTLNGDASVWEPSILTPPQTPSTPNAFPLSPAPALADTPVHGEEHMVACPDRGVQVPADKEDVRPAPRRESCELEGTLPSPAEVPSHLKNGPEPIAAASLEVDPCTSEAPSEDNTESTQVQSEAEQSEPIVNGEVICVSKTAVESSAELSPTVEPTHANGEVTAAEKQELKLETPLTLPQEKVPICNGQVICVQEAVVSESQKPSYRVEISNDSGKDLSEVRTEKETFDVIFNNINGNKQKGKANQSKINSVNEEAVKGGNKIVNSSNGKIKKIKNSSPDHQDSNAFSEETRLSASPAREAVPESETGRSKRDSEKRPPQVSKTKGPSAKRKALKKGAAKTDLSSNAGGSNGMMAQTPPTPETSPAAAPAPAEEPFSLRPETSISWGRRGEDTKVRPVDDVLLQALVGTLPETEPDIPVDSEPRPQLQSRTATPPPAVHPEPPVQSLPQPDPQLKPEPQRSPSPAPPPPEVESAPQRPEPSDQKSRLTPSSAAQRRPKKWRQNTKERAPTPGRELTESTASSSSLSSDEGEEETVIFVSPSAASAPASAPEKPADRDEDQHRESPLRITEAVTAWLRDHETEDILVPPPPHLTSTSDSESESELEDQLDEQADNSAGPKNEVGNPFLASSHSSTTRADPGPGGEVEERVARLSVEPEDALEALEAWDTLCDPTLFVAKYYRLGEDPQDPPVLALELRDNATGLDKGTGHGARSKGWLEQHDSGVHSDESGDEHQTPGHKNTASSEDQQAKRAKQAALNAQAEEFAAKSAYLLRQLKGQSPVPCGGICCSLQ